MPSARSSGTASGDHERDRPTHLPERCRDLGADPAAADDDDPTGRRTPPRGSHRRRRASAGSARPAGRRRGSPVVGVRPGRDQQPVEREPAPVVDDDLALSTDRSPGRRPGAAARCAARRTRPAWWTRSSRARVSPRRYSFESGGRRYGGCGSSPTSVDRARHSPPCAAPRRPFAPARPAPMITIARCQSCRSPWRASGAVEAVAKEQVVARRDAPRRARPTARRDLEGGALDERAGAAVVGAAGDLRRDRQEQLVDDVRPDAGRRAGAGRPRRRPAEARARSSGRHDRARADATRRRRRRRPRPDVRPRPAARSRRAPRRSWRSRPGRPAAQAAGASGSSVAARR